MEADKDVLLQQEKRLKQELLDGELPKHRRTEVEASLYLIDTQLRHMEVKYWWE